MNKVQHMLARLSDSPLHTIELDSLAYPLQSGGPEMPACERNLGTALGPTRVHSTSTPRRWEFLGEMRRLLAKSLDPKAEITALVELAVWS